MLPATNYYYYVQIDGSGVPAESNFENVIETLKIPSQIGEEGFLLLELQENHSAFALELPVVLTLGQMLR